MKSATSSHTYEVILIGAGPSGLSLGHALREMGVQDFCLLEKGPKVGNTWAEMPFWLRLISYWQDNHLRAQDPRRFPSTAQIKAAEFLTYLRELAEGLEVHTEHEVLNVTQDSAGFSIQTNNGFFTTKSLVFCVGYYSAPVLLEESITKESQIPIRHFATLKDLNFDKNRKYLVVGRALSAGQVIEQIHQAGATFDISCRGPVLFGAGPRTQKLFLRYLRILEAVPKRIWPHRSSRVPMLRSAKEVIAQSGAKVVPSIVKISGNRVHFSDGTSASYDEIILATGFRFSGTRVLKGLYGSAEKIEEDLKKLKRGFESGIFPGLFFLGVDNQIDYTSRFLRGIRRDARTLGRLLKF